MAAGRAGSWVRSVIGFIIVVVIIIGVIIYSGIYSVAANYPDRAPVAWVLSTTADYSVRHHAAGIKAPALDDPVMIRTGFGRYEKNCVVCHGAPGVPIGPVGRGLNPHPPELTEAAGDWKPNELFWITRNGVRMSGMPAWGVTLSDKDIWDIVAFTRRLPSLTPAKYKALSSQSPGKQP
jgi:mono/diheme cytochrome c family protein